MRFNYVQRVAAQVKKFSFVQFRGKTWEVGGRKGSLVLLRRDAQTEYVKGNTPLNVLV